MAEDGENGVIGLHSVSIARKGSDGQGTDQNLRHKESD
jgi:hypothetical protein